jgi:hypothetical protein
VLSEWDFTIKPRLEDISKKYPEIKITVNDWVSGFRNFKVHEDYVVDRNVNYSPYGPLRWGFEHIPSISDAIIKKQNVCILWGSDKPRICINNGHYQLYFLDLVANSFTADITHSVYSEMFYWNESCARLVAKQAHLLVNFFESNPRFKQYIQWPISNPANRQFYENVVRAIIYPELDLNFFQTNKMPSWNIAADIVLFRIGDDIENKINRYHSENFKYLRTVIDKKFFQNNGESLTGFISGMYNIRKA